MGLVLTGKLLSRTSTPYDMADDRNPGERIRGTAHKCRVGLGRGEFVDVKLTEEALAVVPPTHDIPEDGTPVEWEVAVAFGKVSFVRDLKSAGVRSAPRPATA